MGADWSSSSFGSSSVAKATKGANGTDEKVARIYTEVDGIDSREGLQKYLLDFKDCALKFGAKNTVFCDGNPEAKIMLIGEAPGEQEDLQGIPFCGKSGQLLDEVLSSIGISRAKNLYISNSIFWRPPANRKPTPEEMAICAPLVEKHIALIKPKLLILCGATAMEAVMGTTGITKAVGRFVDYKNKYLSEPIKAVPIFHPAFLLRNPISKKTTWQNMLVIKKYCQEAGVQLG